jgi:SAM-dependent methyltransferase
MDVGKEFDSWVEVGRDESMERGHFEATMQLISCIGKRISGKNIEDLQSTFVNKTVLDVGCGNGWTLRKFIDLGGRFGIGCDLSTKMIEKARLYSKEQIEYYIGDVSIIHQEILKKQKYSKVDVCLCIESLYYHTDPLYSLRCFYDVLTVGGYVGIMVDLYDESWGTHPWVDALDVDVHLLSIKSYTTLLEKAGFIDIQYQTFQMKSPLTSREDFVENAYYPTYEHYLAYRKAGSLILYATKK